MIFTLELVELVQSCPVLRLGTDLNELGVDCQGCEEADPDRAEVCRRLFRGDEVEIGPDLGVRFREPARLGNVTGEEYSPILEDTL